MKPLITEASFYPLRPNEKGLIGFASCLFNGALALNSISVYTTPNGDIRLLFPHKILPNSKEISIFYPINRETYDAIKEAVVKKIEELKRKTFEKNANGYSKER